MTAVAPFVVDATLTGIAIAYRNPNLIADSLLPRVPVGVKTFRWTKYDTAERFTVPKTLVGRKGYPGEIELSTTQDSSVCLDYGLDDFIPQDDIDQAASNPTPGFQYNPEAHATEALTDLLLLDREIRVANLLQTKANYTNGTTLSGTNQWSDYTNSDPISAMLTALDIPVMRPNVMEIGQAAWTVLRQHPKVVAKVIQNGGNASVGGIITREQLANVLEIEEVVVGQGFMNTAKPGQAASLSRVWGKHCLFIHRNRMANTERGITFGFTAQYGNRVGGRIPEPKRGLRGGMTIRAGETVKELIVAADCGYYFENCVA